MILVDTSDWIDFFNGVENKPTDYLDQLLTEWSVLIGDIILTEILQDFDRDHDFRKSRQALYPFDYVHLGRKPLAIQAASNFRFPRSKSVTVRKTVDMLIGSWCIEHNIELLHNNKDFDRIATELPLQVYVDK